jgi:hypothetical protein
MAWLAGAAGASGAAGGAAAGAAGSAAAGSAAAGAGAGAAGSAAAGTAASTGASAAGSAAGSTAAAEGASAAGAGASGAGEAAAGTSFKDSLIETGKDMAKDKLISEATKQDEAQMYKPTFTPQTISSDINNKYNIQSASFQKHGFKKPDNTSEIGKMVKGLVNIAENEISSSENLKTGKTDVSSNSENKPQSASSRFNAAMKRLGQELGAYIKDEGKDLLSSAIAAGAQPQQVNPVQPGFTGNQISSDENLKTDIDDAGGIVPLFSTIDSYLYKYKPEAQEEYAGTGMMNDDNNLGVMAQELQGNPLTAPAVKTDEKGNLALDTGRLTSINTAMIAELCKKVMELEGQLYGRK